MKGVVDSSLPIIVCAHVTSPLMYADNVVETCMFCAATVQRRPNVPSPHRICCVTCFTERRQADDSVMVTETTLRELGLLPKRTVH